MALFPSGSVDMQIRTLPVSNIAVSSHDTTFVSNCPTVTGYTPISVVFDCSDSYSIFIAYLTSYSGNGRLVRLYNTHSSNFTANGTITILYVKDNLPTS